MHFAFKAPFFQINVIHVEYVKQINSHIHLIHDRLESVKPWFFFLLWCVIFYAVQGASEYYCFSY